MKKFFFLCILFLLIVGTTGCRSTQKNSVSDQTNKESTTDQTQNQAAISPQLDQAIKNINDLNSNNLNNLDTKDLETSF